MSSVKVTIGVPVYNEANYIRECLESITSQTYENLEIIVGDDCSTDNSAEIIQEFCENDSRIKYLKYPENKGLVHNFSFLISSAETPYFCLIGGHDVMEPTYIERCMQEFQKNDDLALVCSQVYEMDKMSNIDKSPETFRNVNDDLDLSKSTNLLEKLVKVNDGLHACYALHGVYKTEVIQDIQFRDVICGDGYLIYSSLFYGNIYQINEPLLIVREVRHESMDQIMERYARIGITRKGETFSQASKRLLDLKLERSFGTEKLSFIEKIKLGYAIYKKEKLTADIGLIDFIITAFYSYQRSKKVYV